MVLTVNDKLIDELKYIILSQLIIIHLCIINGIDMKIW